ncbi:MAG: PadR family transcriptional regulator [Candidatus Aminicenantes bacterium]|nr:PadR family transcriptional regulator [Candidatus Aminicenantes bacterium]
MKLLSSHDEILLLAILGLGDEAYGVTIRRAVSKAIGKDWSIGAVYDPLYRLEQKGYVASLLSEPTNERGGRSKRIFRVTPHGIKALGAQKTIRDRLRQKISENAFKHT